MPAYPPWNCPNPYCESPHNPSSEPVDGKVRCRSCGWERPAARATKPVPLDNVDGLFDVPAEPSEPK